MGTTDQDRSGNYYPGWEEWELLPRMGGVGTTARSERVVTLTVTPGGSWSAVLDLDLEIKRKGGVKRKYERVYK